MSHRHPVAARAWWAAWVAWGLCSAPAVAQPGATTPHAEHAELPTPPSAHESEGAGRETTDATAGPRPTAERMAEARERFDRGLELYQEGDHELALIEFERAYELVPDHRVLYNIAQVSVMLGHYSRAQLVLQEYLAAGGDTIPEARREQVAKDLEMLAGRTARLLVRANPAGAEVWVDGEPWDTTPMDGARLLDAGPHDVVVRREGYTSQRRRVKLAAGDEAELELGLEREPVARPTETIVVREKPEPVVRPVPARPVARPRDDTLIWAGWGTTGALAGGSALMWWLGNSAYGDWEDLKQDPALTSDRPLKSKETQARSFLLAADLLGLGALALGGVSLYFTLAGDRQSDPLPRDASATHSGLSVQLGPGRVDLQGRF